MLKRGRYVHCVYDASINHHVVVDLNTKRRLVIDERRFPAFERVLREPNEIQSFSPTELAVRELLERLSFLLPANYDEIADLEQRYWAEKRCVQNLSLGIVLTQKCNFRCVYCNQEHFGDSLSSNDAARIVAFVEREAPNLEQFYVTWWGGEPLLKLKTIESLTQQFLRICDAHSVVYRAFTSTNASLITPEVAARLSELRLSQYQISIDGPRELHDAQRPLANNAGTYDSVLSGLKNLVRASRANSPFITLRVHTTGLLHADHQAWAKFLDDLDECKVFIKLHFIAAHDSFRFGSEQTVSSKDMTLRLSDVLDEARNRGFVLAESALLNRDTLMHCGAISDRSWFVLPGSRLTRCNSAFNDPKNDCGSLDDHGFMHLYDRAKEWIDHSPFTYSECVNCDVLPICMGGCRIVDFKHPSDARCQIKRSVRAAILESTRSYKTEVRVDT